MVPQHQDQGPERGVGAGRRRHQHLSCGRAGTRDSDHRHSTADGGQVAPPKGVVRHPRAARRLQLRHPRLAEGALQAGNPARPGECAVRGVGVSGGKRGLEPIRLTRRGPRGGLAPSVGYSEAATMASCSGRQRRLTPSLSSTSAFWALCHRRWQSLVSSALSLRRPHAGGSDSLATSGAPLA